MTPLLQVTLDFASEAEVQELAGSGTTFGGYIGSILSGVMMIALILLLVYLLWGAIEWVTAGGDSSKIQKARDKITQAVIGVIVLAASVAIFNIVQQFIGVQVLDFQGRIVDSPQARQAMRRGSSGSSGGFWGNLGNDVNDFLRGILPDSMERPPDASMQAPTDTGGSTQQLQQPGSVQLDGASGGSGSTTDKPADDQSGQPRSLDQL